MAIKRFSSSFKTRDDVFDNITPNNVVQSNIAAPAGEWKPARYLPIQWTGSASKDAFVLSSGKIVCLDNDGRIADMTISTLAGVGLSTVVVTYTSVDVAYGVYDIVTGLPVTAAGSRTAAVVATGLMARGAVVLGRDIEASEFVGANYAAGQAADVLAVIRAFFSLPVGVCAYDVFCWAGDTPDELVFTNYQKQHLVQFLTEIQLKAPIIANGTPSTTAGGPIASGNAITALDGVTYVQGARLTNASLVALDRYSSLSANGNFVGLVIDKAGVATNTSRTPITEATAMILLSQKTSPLLLTSFGDWYLDGEIGLILAYSSGGVFGSGAGQLQSSAVSIITYTDLDGTSQDHRGVHAVGPLRPGDKLTWDAQSNFAKAPSGATVVGTCLALITEPRGLLDRVQTAFAGSSFSASAQMPGTATGGYSDNITLSEETVADQLAIINVRI